MRYNDVGEPIGRFSVRNGAFVHPISAECYDCFPGDGCRFCPVAARERQIAECGYALDDEYSEGTWCEEQYQKLSDLIER